MNRNQFENYINKSFDDLLNKYCPQSITESAGPKGEKK